jgi:predicted cupin superfamily sugar epimerase
MTGSIDAIPEGVAQKLILHFKMQKIPAEGPWFALTYRSEDLLEAKSLLYPDGRGEIVIVGPDVFSGQHPQFVVPRDVWQGSLPIGAGLETYSFFGNTLAPGFEFQDFEMGYRDELQAKYPQFTDHIARRTRSEFVRRT